jgi:membrane protein implicated in regulation of membrane protease activity
MNDKPMAGMVTFLIAAPAMLLCCLAPFVFVSSVSGLLSWLAGGSIVLGGMVAAATGVTVFLVHRHRRRRSNNFTEVRHSDSAETSAHLADWEHN